MKAEIKMTDEMEQIELDAHQKFRDDIEEKVLEFWKTWEGEIPHWKLIGITSSVLLTTQIDSELANTRDASYMVERYDTALRFAVARMNNDQEAIESIREEVLKDGR